MLACKVWTLLLVLPLAFNITVVVAEVDDHVHAINDPMIVRHLQGPPEPPWFPRISASFVGGNLQRCSKRSEAPKNGSKCSPTAKTCFFGNQDCPGVGPHPVTKCVCSSQKWMCQAEPCPPPTSPPTSSPDDSANRCTAAGEADLSSNDPLCPLTPPLQASPTGWCVPALYGKTCFYGTEKWYVMCAGLLCGGIVLDILA